MYSTYMCVIKLDEWLIYLDGYLKVIILLIIIYHYGYNSCMHPVINHQSRLRFGVHLRMVNSRIL